MPAPGAQNRIVKQVSSWPGVTAHAHRFGGTEFMLGRRELGHVHGDYQADIPFPFEVRNQLIAEGRAEPHNFVPDSGWITFRFRSKEDIDRAISLFRLCYDIASGKPSGKEPVGQL